MKNAKLSVIAFNDNDVIATSGAITVTWVGLYDNTPNNVALIYNGVSYLGNSGKTLADLNSATGLNITTTTGFVYQLNPDKNFKIFNLETTDTGTQNSTKEANYNGTYTWDPTKYAGVAPGAFVKSTN